MLAIYVESNIYNEKSINSPQCLSLYMELKKKYVFTHRYSLENAGIKRNRNE